MGRALVADICELRELRKMNGPKTENVTKGCRKEFDNILLRL
jgi:hypothetical protein